MTRKELVLQIFNGMLSNNTYGRDECAIMETAIIMADRLNDRVDHPHKRYWVNIYTMLGSNDFVCGRNFYDTHEDAMKSQKCPPGYYYLKTIQQRSFEW